MPELQVASVDNYSVGGPALGLHIGTLATGTVVMTGQPSDTDTVTIDDGIVAAAIIFEFDSGGGVTGDNTVVTIGGSAAATMAALKAAIDASALALTSADTTGGGDPETTLTHTVRGTVGNASTIVEAAANTTRVDFAGAENEVVATHVAKFRVTKGGKVDLRFENQSDNVLTVSVHVSVDGVTYALLTSSNNLAAVTDASIAARCAHNAAIALRQGVDNYMRIAVSGGGRVEAQLRKHAGLEITKI